MVYYLKFRPQNLAELIGQDGIKKVLENSLKLNQFSHAYLFCGPKGTGKTSTARILAKLINCEKYTPQSALTEIPCNTCRTCVSITDGSNLDLVEIDAASNRGIDDIRALREKIKLAPTNAKKKIYIIDEVHMLTTEAFNALLKTLEEPPAHAVFILATTEVHKIPATILSRVERLEFQLASSDQLKQALSNVVKKEKLEVDDDAITVLAQKAEGSFRDALKLLNQYSLAGEILTGAKLEEFFKAGSSLDQFSLLEAVGKKDAQKTLQLLHEQVRSGINIREFSVSLLDVLRKVLYIQHGVIKDLEADKNIANLKNLGQVFSQASVLKVVHSLESCLQTLKHTNFPDLALEVALLENCVAEEKIVQKVVVQEVSETVSVEREKPIASAKIPAISVSVDTPSDHANLSSSDLQKLKDKWQFILETVKPYNFSLEALLRQVKIVSCDDGTALLEVPYSFHQRIIEAPKSRDLLESIVSEVLGKQSRVRTVLGSRPVRVEEIANVELAQDDDVIKIAAEIFNS